MIDLASCLKQLLMVKDWHMAKTKGDADCISASYVLFIEVATLAALAENSS